MSPGAARAAPLILLAAACLAYLPSLFGDYVYDDHRFVEKNPAVQDGAPLAEYFTDPATQAAGDSHQGIYRPIRTLSFRLVALVGSGAEPQRVANLLIHFLNGVLVLVLLRRLLPGVSAWAHALGAAVFVAHPAAVEAVAWISSRGDLLALTFILGALLLHLRDGTAPFLVSLPLFFLALLSKESAMVLPILAVLLDLGEGRAAERAWRYAVLLIIFAAWTLVRIDALGPGGFGQGAGQNLSQYELLGTLLTGVAWYSGEFFVPVGFTFEERPGWPLPGVALGVVLLVGSFIAAALIARRARALSLAILWFLIALLPVTLLQFLLPLKIGVAARFLYPALVAAALAAAWVASRSPRLLAGVAVVLLAFLPLTFGRADVWKDDESLYSRKLRSDPEHPVALYGFGHVCLKRGELTRAVDLLERARVADPGCGIPTIRRILGEALALIADRLEPGSPERRSYVKRAFGAYHEAAVAWSLGSREMRHLFRETALRAAWLALSDAVARPELAVRHAQLVVNRQGSLRENRLWNLAVLKKLSEHFAVTRPDLAHGLRELAERLESES